MTRSTSIRIGRRASSVALLALPVLAGCTLLATPTPAPTVVVTLSPSPIPTALPSETASASAEETPSPSPSPEPLSLDLPGIRDDRQLRVAINADLPTDGNGTLTVTITNLSQTRIDEIVLRWPSELDTAIFLAPFTPSEDRIREGGPPLTQAWTKWVVGPGERGEPSGTTSLGYGPMDPGMQLDVPLVATRATPGALAFDLQLLAGEALLTMEDGSPAELRVELP